MMLRIKNEELYIMGYCVVFLVVTAWVDGPWRSALGLPMVFFLPGYALVSAMFPRKQPLEGWGRVALSFAFQVLVIPVLGLGLSHTPWELRPYPVLAMSTMLVLVSSGVAYYRRLKIPEEERFVPTLALPEWVWPRKGWGDRALSILVITAVAVATGAFAFAIARPLFKERVTEFYLLGVDGRAGKYIQEVAVGEKMTVIAGVVNGEEGPTAFKVEMRVDGVMQEKRVSTQALAPGVGWQDEMSFTALQPGKYKVEFLLYRDGEAEPYRVTHLWLTVIYR